MKTRNIIILALTALLAVSCHSWDAPGEDAGRDSYGNPDLKETNVKTIAEVKEMFKDEINNSDLKKVEERMQLKVVVTGNDEGSNLYKSLYVQDNTGAIALSIDQGGLFGPFAVGQCVLIDLKDLYVGGYEKQPQIGVLYFNENKGVDQVGRMTRYEWQRHYKLLQPVEGLEVKPIVTDNISKLNLERDCGKLVTLVGIKMKDADGVKVFAPSDGSVTLLGGCANRDIDGQSNVVIRTSTYAKFANMPMPTERITVTGIASRYRDGWQLMPRKQDDIKPYTGTEVLDDIDDPSHVDATGDGTAAAPFNIAAAIAKCQEVGETQTTEKYYIKGFAVTEGVADANYGNATFDMADTPDGSNLFKAYQVYGSDGKKLPAGYTVKKGDEVVVYGPVVNYKGNTPETAGKGAAIIVSINGKKTDGSNAGDPSTDQEQDPGDAKAVTIAEFNAAAVSNDVWYQLTGTVKNLKDGDQYGNFDLEDETGSVYVYGLLAEQGGEKKKFQELVAAKGIKDGSKITIIGTRGEYNGKIEVMNAYFVSIDNSGSGESGNGDSPTPIVNNGTLEQPFTPAEANAFVSQLEAGVTTDESYYIKGKIIEITDKDQFSTKYGDCTFYISDDGTDKADKFYVFRTLYLGNVKYTSGTLPKAGDEVIICGQLVNYMGNTPETAASKSYIYSLNGQTE